MIRTRPAPLLVAASVLLGAGYASGQQLDLPRPSPNAKVTQQVGLTDVTVEYSCPGVKGRAIWGAVVPYDQLWRTGANAATKVTFSKDVKVGASKVTVPAGTYSLFTIPAKDQWTVILNKNAQAQVREYKQAEDVARITVKPAWLATSRERLAFLFDDTTDEGTSVALEWEKLHLAIPVHVDTDAQVAANLKGLDDNAWRPWNAAARYLLETKKDADGALKYVDRSLSLREDWLNVWTKAQALAAKGRTKEARALAEKAYALGQKSELFFYEADVKKALAEWKK